VTTTFHFSGNSITTETQGANVVAHYVYGVNRVSRDASGSFEYYHADGLGSTRQLSNDSQTITQTTTYDAFGNIESSAGSSSNAYKYAGQWGYRNDGDDGLMHVGARYYDPLVGRFISADTYLGDIGNPQSLNRYVYAENDPVNFVDPSGHKKRPPPKVTVGVKITPGKPNEFTIQTDPFDVLYWLIGWPKRDDKQPKPINLPPLPPNLPPGTTITIDYPDGTKVTITLPGGGGGGGQPPPGGDDDCL